MEPITTKSHKQLFFFTCWKAQKVTNSAVLPQTWQSWASLTSKVSSQSSQINSFKSGFAILEWNFTIIRIMRIINDTHQSLTRFIYISVDKHSMMHLTTPCNSIFLFFLPFNSYQHYHWPVTDVNYLRKVLKLEMSIMFYLKIFIAFPLSSCLCRDRMAVSLSEHLRLI